MLEWFIIPLIMFIGALLQGITGFGSGLIVVPLLSLLLPLTLLTPALSLVNVALTAYLCWRLRAHLHHFQYGALLIAGCLASIIGAISLHYFDPKLLQLLLAIGVTATGIVFWFGVKFPLSAHWTAQFLVGLLAGFSNGALTLGGPPVVLYFSQLNLPKFHFRGALSVFFLALALTNVATFASQGEYQATTLLLSFKLLLGAILGATVGHSVSQILSEEIFRKLTLLTVIFAGLVALTGVF